jgi:hypothetical protein
MKKLVLGLVMVMMLTMVGCGKDNVNNSKEYVTLTTVSDVEETDNIFYPLKGMGKVVKEEVKITGGIPGATQLLAQLDNRWVIGWEQNFLIGDSVQVVIYDHGTPTIPTDDVLLGYWK